MSLYTHLLYTNIGSSQILQVFDNFVISCSHHFESIREFPMVPELFQSDTFENVYSRKRFYRIIVQKYRLLCVSVSGPYLPIDQPTRLYSQYTVLVKVWSFGIYRLTIICYIDSQIHIFLSYIYTCSARAEMLSTGEEKVERVKAEKIILLDIVILICKCTIMEIF